VKEYFAPVVSQFSRANVKFERPKANGRTKLALSFQWDLTPGMA
jgi:hypothetical protein